MANLFFGYLGNGLTVCDKDRIVHGDYKTVAHIDNCGAVRFYDDGLTIYEKKRINAHAKHMAAQFKTMFLNLDKYKALDMLDAILWPSQWVDVFHAAVGKGIDGIYRTYIEYICKNNGYEMPEM